MSTFDQVTAVLARELTSLGDGDVYIFRARHRVVQFLQDTDTIEVMASSNLILDPADALSEADETWLAASGWQPPVRPSKYWTQVISWPPTTASAQHMAQVITSALRVLLADEPHHIDLEACNIDTGQPVATQLSRLMSGSNSA